MTTSLFGRAAATHLAFGLTLLVSGASAQQLSSVAPGYRLGALANLDHECGGSLATDGFADGTYVAYDGVTVERRSAAGLVLQRYAAFPGFAFPSFVSISPDEQTIAFGESSTGAIWTVPAAGGMPSFVTTLAFNFDLAFDTTPGQAYVSASTGSFGTNSVYRVDLASGIAIEVVSITGFSGPIAVDDQGDVLLVQLPDVFPFPAGGTDVLRFADAALDGPNVLGEADATLFAGGLNGASSIEWDLAGDQLVVAETNAGASGFGTEFHLHGPNGVRRDTFAEASVFAGGVEVVDAGVGTVFGAYQPPFASVRYMASDCFGTGVYERVEVLGARPRGTWSGPSQGSSGPAAFALEGAIPNGFAALWAARIVDFQANTVVTSLGGTYPLALRAGALSFVRRFTVQPVDSLGATQLDYWQDPAIEGGFFGQWVVFDAAMNPISTTEAAINRAAF